MTDATVKCEDRVVVKPRHLTSGVYIGKIAHLKGKTATILNQDGPCYNVQFDDLDLVYKGVSLGLGWHIFPIGDFEVTP